MKQLTIRSISLLLALIMVFMMIPTAQAYVADSWAQPELAAMRDLELIPSSLMKANLVKGISRLDMCRIAVLSYEKITGETIRVTNKQPFPDTTDVAAAKAYAVGLVKGNSDGKFYPNTILTREQFVAFVAQFLTAIDYPVTKSNYASLSSFSDSKSVPSWVKQQTQLAVGLGIVKGSGGKLNLSSRTTAQEAIVMFYRTYMAALKGLNGSYSNAASWAKDSLNAMDKLGLVPDTVKYNSMSGTITRLEMCQIVMNTYKKIWGISDKDLGTVSESPFTDTKNVDVINASRLQIVSGDGNGKFRPNDPITRQEFFKITYNFLNAMGYLHKDDSMVDLSEYPDSSKLNQNYAVSPTRVLIALGIVKGDENKNLHPQDKIVSQEAIVIFYRSYEFILNWSDESNNNNGGTDNRTDKDLTTIQKVINLALEIEKDDSLWYVYGGKKPSDGGFDCSGFVSYVYNQKAGTKFSPPVSSIWKAISDKNIIPKDKLLPGDIVFFWNDSKTDFQHVGLYIGDGKFVHAANSRVGIIISSLDEPYYLGHYMDAKRVIN